MRVTWLLCSGSWLQHLIPLACFSLKPAHSCLSSPPSGSWRGSSYLAEIPALGITLVLWPERRQCCSEPTVKLSTGWVVRGGGTGTGWVEKTLSFLPLTQMGTWSPGLEGSAGAGFQEQQPGRSKGEEIWGVKESNIAHRSATGAVLPATENPTQVAYKFPRSTQSPNP